MISVVKHQDHQVEIRPSTLQDHILLSVWDKVTNKMVAINLNPAQAGLIAFGLETALPSEL